MATPESRSGSFRVRASARARHAARTPSPPQSTSASLPSQLFDYGVTGIVMLLPFTAALWRAAASAQWRGDLPALRDQAMVAIAPGGGVATVVTKAIGLLPLGSSAFRGALGSALALSLCALLLHRIARHVLALLADRLPPISAPLSCLLCGIAACAATLSPTWQREATVGGGATIAGAAVLLTLLLALQVTAPTIARTSRASGRWLLLGAVVGAALAESLPAGLAAFAVVAATLLAAWRLPRAPGGRLGLLGFALVAPVLSAPLLLRTLAPRTVGDVGRALSASSVAAFEVAGSHETALAAWLQELGIASLGLAALGVGLALLERPSRRAVAPLVTLVAVDLLYPMAATASLSSDPLAALRLLAVGALAIASAVGIGALVAFLIALQVPMARPAAVLTIVFHLTLVAVTSEEAGFATDRSEHFAAEAWTDEAFGALPPRAAVLVHSPELAWRLWRTRTSRGRRPDVLVVPAPLLHHPRVMAALLPAEPSIAPLLREFALTGEASEYALSVLADARPLHVELHPQWGERLLSHLYVEGLWLRYTAQALGKSDRKPRRQQVLAPGSPVVAGITAGQAPDAATARVVTRTLKEHASVLSLLRMPTEAQAAIDRVEQIEAGDAFVTGARLRLAYADEVRNRTVELRDLLRF